MASDDTGAMVRRPHLTHRAEELLGTAVVSSTSVAGGDICTSTRMRLSDGTSVLMKTRPQAPPGFFVAEARGLRWLGSGEGPHMAEVRAVAEDALVVEWHEPERPSAEAAARFGRELATLHRAGAESFGVAEPSFIGTLPLAAGGAATWPEFYATKRVLPYLKLARDRGHLDEEQCARVEAVVRRLDVLAGPPEPPARIHGDLWSGNVVWSGGSGVLIDPAAQGGHRETDLAMLALFGSPHHDATIAAYDENAPLADGWRERIPLHQLHPLLVHAALFGGSYGEQAARAADRMA